MRHPVNNLLLSWTVLRQISVSGYITTGLPGPTHVAWLKQMTSDVKRRPVGELSSEMCTITPQILSVWAKNPYIPNDRKFETTFPHHGLECALACEELLKRLVDERKAGNIMAVASTTVYNALIDVWARSGEDNVAAVRAEQILLEMQSAYATGETSIQPDLTSFKIVLRAWSKAGNAQRAQRILEWMMELCETEENDGAQPDEEIFEIALHSWMISDHVDAPLKVEKIITWMGNLSRKGDKSVGPTITTFNYLLEAWTKSKKAGATCRAYDILNEMDKISKQKGMNHLRPNIHSYSMVLSKCGENRNLDSAYKADLIIKRMEKMYRRGDMSIIPQTSMYNSVIDVLAKDSSEESCRKILSILERQVILFQDGANQCKPDVNTFTSVLSSHASLAGSMATKIRAFKKTEKIFDTMLLLGISPSRVTYGNMLKASVRLLPAGKKKQEIIKKYISRCSEEGCIGDMVIRWLQRGATPEVYTMLVGGIRDTLLSQQNSKVSIKEGIRVDCTA